jgi:hypothetical protein
VRWQLLDMAARLYEVGESHCTLAFFGYKYQASRGAFDTRDMTGVTRVWLNTEVEKVNEAGWRTTAVMRLLHQCLIASSQVPALLFRGLCVVYPVKEEIVNS